MKKKILIGSAILIVALAGIVFWRSSVAKSKSQTDVQTVTLKKGNLLDSVLVSGTIKSSNTQNVYSKVTTYPIKEVYFKVGDKVKAGDVLTQLDTSSLELDIKQTELNIKSAEESLKNEEASNNYNLQKASNDLESASVELNSAQDSYDKAKKLYEAGASSQDEFLKAESTLKKVQISYNNTKVSLNNMKNKNTSTTKNDIESQKAALEKQKKTLSDCKIVSPIDGTVTIVNAKQNGASAGLLFVVEDTDNLIVSTQIGEYDINSIKVGQEVSIKTDGTGDKEFIGTVSKIAPTAKKDESGNTTSSSNVEFDTEVTPKDRDESIKIAMNARLTIKLKEKKDVYSVPYDAVVTETDGTKWIYVMDTTENAPKKIKVQTGMETDMYIEVTSLELKDGMKVVTNPKKSTSTTKGSDK